MNCFDHEATSFDSKGYLDEKMKCRDGYDIYLYRSNNPNQYLEEVVARKW
jgi:hypothetical protein